MQVSIWYRQRLNKRSSGSLGRYQIMTENTVPYLHSQISLRCLRLAEGQKEKRKSASAKFILRELYIYIYSSEKNGNKQSKAKKDDNATASELELQN
jgi:hypothetical protein